MPKVSILMSCYNHEKFVAQAIESVIQQSFIDWEFLIIDDCSTDQTFAIAKNFANKDQRIKAFRADYNSGMVQHTNKLINQAQGEYIAIIKSDDSWQKEKLEKQVKFLDHNPEYAICFTLSNIIDEENNIIISDKNNAFITQNKNRYQWLQHFFYHDNCLCYPSSLARKTCYVQVGFFNPAFICLLDLDMWIRICLAGYEIYIIEEFLTNFRLLKNNSNLSSINQTTMVRGGLENERILHNYYKITNYEEFIKIFPNYSKKVPNHYPGFIYLIDLAIKFFYIKKHPNINNIKNFGLNLLHQAISNDPDILKILEKDFDFSFKKYLYITGLYPSGINLYEQRMARKNKWYQKIKRILKAFKKVFLRIMLENHSQNRANHF